MAGAGTQPKPNTKHKGQLHPRSQHTSKNPVTQDHQQFLSIDPDVKEMKAMMEESANIQPLSKKFNLLETTKAN